MKTSELVDVAYKKLKQDNYYDTVNLFLRHRIAQFETSDDFKERLNNVESVVDQLQWAKVEENELLKEWIGSISFRCLSKKIKWDSLAKKDTEGNEESPCYITNVRTSDLYKVESVNYFIDAPIELHILDVIWSMEVGDILDKQIDEYCLGNRLERTDEEKHQPSYVPLFKIYHRQYEKWRDTAIKKAEKALENDTNVLIIGLDIKQCYYHLETDWAGIEKTVHRYPFKQALCKAIQRVGSKYHGILKPYLHITHPTAKSLTGLPVGLSSSSIIANWMLSRFDNEVKSKLCPLYYGRYVDDMLIVLQSPPSSVSNGSESLVDELFLQNKLMAENGKKEKEYSLNCLPELKIQSEKLIFQYFDAAHSHAGLKEFSREIAAQASEFRFLPVGDDMRGLDDCAYDLIYMGSVNKLRSVVGLKENSIELSKYLSRRIVQYRLCRNGLDKKHVDQLFRFYKGRNIFDFCRLWEKVFTLLLTNHKESDCTKFYKQCFDVIDKLNAEQSIQDKLKLDMNLYLNLALTVPIGLMSTNFKEECKSRRLQKLVSKIIEEKEISKIAKAFRKSNMIRHQFVSYPLLNYTSYDGDLVSALSDELPPITDWDITERVKYSPRYIHHDEIQLFAILQCLIDKHKRQEEYVKVAEEVHKQIHAITDIPVTYTFEKKVHYIRCSQSKKGESLNSVIVGIANMKVYENDIRRAFKPMQKQNLSYKRQSNLYALLNAALEKEKCDIVIFPELSIPFAWVPTMVSFSRTHQIGLVFGVEHVVISQDAHNLVITILPYKDEYKHKGCFISARLKNHYAPSEENDLRIYSLNAITPDPAYYELFQWKGMFFSVFNCFELTNIAHRGFMQSELDFLVTVAWNKDTDYYDNILSAATRDLHCYIVHSNTSQYGDSRVTAPQRQAEMDYIRVKGGINSVLMKAELNLENLRDFQIKGYDPNDSRFKPTPAGYNREKAKLRARDA